MVADYWIVRKRKWVIPHLFIGTSESTYWYTGGWNLRAVGCMLFAMWPSIRKWSNQCFREAFPDSDIKLRLAGLAMNIQNQENENAWVRMFQINYFIGAPLAFITYITVVMIWPPVGSGIQLDMPEQIEGLDGALTGGASEEGVINTEKTVAHTEKSVSDSGEIV